MTADEAAIALLFAFNIANAFLLWRVSNGCRQMARAVADLQRARRKP